jgi:beta-glucanase (GH16 family)
VVLPAVIQAQTWTQVWADNFDSGAGNNSVGGGWAYDLGGGGWGNSELQCYQNGTANAWKTNGVLTIEARRQNACGNAYTSARLKTQGIRSFGPGDAYPVKVSARLAGPSGQGLWPAFWMLGTNIGSNPWPGCGEIDVMEHVNAAGNVYGTIHWNGPSGYASYTAASPGMSSFGSYHWYAITWNASQITWRLDNTQVGAANIANNVNSTEEFHRPFFIILNLAVGGTWPGSPNASTVFPARLYVDSVRYDRG